MKNLFYTLFIFLFCAATSVTAQTVSQVRNQSTNPTYTPSGAVTSPPLCYNRTTHHLWGYAGGYWYDLTSTPYIDLDPSPTNEKIVSFSVVAGVLRINENGIFYNVPINDIIGAANISSSSPTITVTNVAGVVTVSSTDPDEDATNEIQTITQGYGTIVTPTGVDYTVECDTTKIATQYDLTQLTPPDLCTQIQALPTGTPTPTDKIVYFGGGCFLGDAPAAQKAANGLNVSNDTIKLGGVFTENTLIDQLGFKLDISNNTSGIVTHIAQTDTFLGLPVAGVGTAATNASDMTAYQFSGDFGGILRNQIGVQDFTGADTHNTSIQQNAVAGNTYTKIVSTDGASSAYSQLQVRENSTEIVANNGTNVNTLTLEADKLIVSQYPNTRDDSGVTLPINFLYTNGSGEFLSAPTSGIVTNEWHTTGNAGTDGGTTNFVGTTDAQDFVVKTNSIEIARFGQQGNAAFGSDLTTINPSLIAPTANNIGSMAFQSGQATGVFSTAFQVSTASGDLSTAFGEDNIASGDLSTAFGGKNTASGDNSTAFGSGNIASGNYSTAFGLNNTASGGNSFTFGENNIASGLNSTAFGGKNTASGLNSTAFGQENTASGNISVAFGGKNTASGLNSTAFGSGNIASGGISFACGGNNTASGDNSTVLGANNIASGNYSTALGLNVTAQSGIETVLGQYNTTYSPASTIAFDVTDRLFTIGNGVNNVTPNNALTLWKDGRSIWNGDIAKQNTWIGVNGTNPQNFINITTPTGSLAAISTEHTTSGNYAVLGSNAGNSGLVINDTKQFAFTTTAGTTSTQLGSTSTIANYSASGFKIGGNSAATSTLDVTGSFSLPVFIVNTTTTITSNHCSIECNNGATNITLTLPDPTTCRGRIYMVHRNEGSTGTVTINPGGGLIQALAGTLGATTSISALGSYGQHVWFQSDGTNWLRVN